MKTDTMLFVYGAVFMFVAAVVALLLLAYLYLREKEKPAKKKPHAKPKARAAAQQAKIETPGKVSPLPPDVPRTLGTVKIIAEEKPDWIINIIRRWLRQK